MAAGTFSNKEFPAGKEKQEHTSSENRVESGGNFNGLLIQQYVECCRIYNRLKATAAVSYSQEYVKASKLFMNWHLIEMKLSGLGKVENSLKLKIILIV